VEGRLSARPVEGAAQYLAVDRDHSRAGIGKRRHEPLKRDPELAGIEAAEQPAEGVMTGRTVGQIEELSEEWLFGSGEQRHIHTTLAAAQDGA
jgi:hypothetical protein